MATSRYIILLFVFSRRVTMAKGNSEYWLSTVEIPLADGTIIPTYKVNKFMKRIQFESRDNARTPFHWDASKNAGFSTGNPWIQVSANYKTINRAAEEKGTQSVLNYFRNATALRINNPALIYGKYTILDKSNPDIYAYTRELYDQKFLILLNFSNHVAKVNTGMNLNKAKLVLANYSMPLNDGDLQPYEALVYQLK